MKATGIIRRIDDLGRIVIPKEIRKSLGLTEGTPMEMYIDSDGEVIFKRYSNNDNVEEQLKILDDLFQDMKDYEEYPESVIGDMQNHVRAIHKLLKGGRRDGKTI